MRCVLVFLFVSCAILAQNNAVTTAKTECNCEEKYKSGRGTFYISWGYNKDYFTRSNIRFYNPGTQNYPNAGTVNGYDFIIQKVKATDRPRFNQLFRSSLSVPQYSYRVGYYFNGRHNLGVELNFDHAKYVMVDNQYAHIKGMINGNYYDVDTLITTKMLRFEHTDGANFLMLNFLKRRTLLSYVNERHRISMVFKAGAGIVVPKTDIALWGEQLDNKFHIAGYITGIDVGLRYDLYRYFFLEASGKSVFADYRRVLTIGSGRASHHFFAYEWLGAIGFQFPL